MHLTKHLGRWLGGGRGGDDRRQPPHEPINTVREREDPKATLIQLLDAVGRQETALSVLDRRLGELGGLVSWYTDIITETLRRAGWQSDEEAEEQRRLRRVLQLTTGETPIVAGPWTGEIGFELLYWIPFLSWLKTRGVGGRDIVVVSRGGVAPWYRHITDRYVDILDHCSVDEFRSRTGETKQRRVGEFDRALVTRVIEQEHLRDAELLHPSLMYRLFAAFWRGRAAAEFVESFTAFQPFHAEHAPPPVEGLPDRYVAAKFYFNRSFRASSRNRAFIRSVLGAVGQHVPVVLLTTGLQIDDHEEFETRGLDRIQTLQTQMSAAANLSVQTAVIRGAIAFVGTYGGFSYLAPFWGVPSLSFFSDREQFGHHHLELAQRVFSRLAPGGFLALDCRDLELVAPAVERWLERSSAARMTTTSEQR